MEAAQYELMKPAGCSRHLSLREEEVLLLQNYTKMLWISGGDGLFVTVIVRRKFVMMYVYMSNRQRMDSWGTAALFIY